MSENETGNMERNGSTWPPAEIIGILKIPDGHNLQLGYGSEVFRLASMGSPTVSFHAEQPIELRIEPVDNGSLFHIRELCVQDSVAPAKLTLHSSDASAKACVIHYTAAGEFFYSLLHQVTPYGLHNYDKPGMRSANDIEIDLEVIDVGKERRLLLTDGNESFHPVYYNGESVGETEDCEVPEYVTAANTKSKPVEEPEVMKPSLGITRPSGLSKPGERTQSKTSRSM